MRPLCHLIASKLNTFQADYRAEDVRVQHEQRQYLNF